MSGHYEVAEQYLTEVQKLFAAHQNATTDQVVSIAHVHALLALADAQYRDEPDPEPVDPNADGSSWQG